MIAAPLSFRRVFAGNASPPPTTARSTSSRSSTPPAASPPTADRPSDMTAANTSMSCKANSKPSSDSTPSASSKEIPWPSTRQRRITTETLRRRSFTPCPSSYTSTRHKPTRADPSDPMPYEGEALNDNTTGGPETDGPRRVGFIGLGNMGFAMAARLIEAGYQVTVWARTASKVDALVERGAVRGEGPEDAIGTGVVFSMLSNDDAVREVFTPERLNAAPE